MAIEIFLSYAHADEELMNSVRQQLVVFEREGQIIKWYDREIPPGIEWKSQIDQRLKRAQIILLFVSPSFLESKYCYDIEVKEALKQHKSGKATVIPIILRPCAWEVAPFGKLQALPKDAKPLSQWDDLDQVCLDVARAVIDEARKIANEKNKPSSKADSKQTKFTSIQTVEDFIQVLQDSFSFRWEPATFLSSQSDIVIYWPVKLRQPTPIHAVQCFAAAGLQRIGGKIMLFLDDFGHAEASTDEFLRAVKKWFKVVKGNYDSLEVRICSETIPHSQEVWTLLQNWFKHEKVTMAEVLQVSKLLQNINIEEADLKEVAKSKPRRLMTPAVVWACLVSILKEMPNARVLTLGGFDERALWNAWRRRANESFSFALGHLYVPELFSPETAPGQVLHMARTKIAWDSVGDIKEIFQEELSKKGSENLKSLNRIVPWCFSGCVMLPAFLAGEKLKIRIASKNISSLEDLKNIDDSKKVVGVLSKEVAKWVL